MDLKKPNFITRLRIFFFIVFDTCVNALWTPQGLRDIIFYFHFINSFWKRALTNAKVIEDLNPPKTIFFGQYLILKCFFKHFWTSYLQKVFSFLCHREGVNCKPWINNKNKKCNAMMYDLKLGSTQNYNYIVERITIYYKFLLL